MSATFVGMLACPPSHHNTRRPDGLTTLEFANGFLAQTRARNSFQDGHDLSLAVGTAHFDDKELARTAANAGQAAAWLAAFRQYGPTAPAHARGRFAVVIFNPSRPSLTLAVDRFGTYPLCYSGDHSHCAFSDHACAVPVSEGDIDPQAIFDYLYFHVIPAPRTVHQGVSRLPAAHTLTWSGYGLRLERYWQPRFAPDPKRDLESSKAEFLAIVARAVERESRKSGVGAFLSGGTDSSTVAGMLCKAQGKPAPTYSIGFDAQGYDEMEFARLASLHFGTEHHEYYVTADDLVEALPRVATHYDQPFGNSSVAPAWICASRARADGITRLLAGDGGDELFGGNARYAKQTVFELYGRVPRFFRSALLEPALGLPGMNRFGLTRKAASYVEQANVPLPDRLEMYNLLLRLGPQEVFEPAFLVQIDTGAPLAAQREIWTQSEGDTLIDRMLAFDWKYTLADNDLPKVTGATGLAGLGVSFPLLDEDLIDFSLTLPPDWKLSRNRTLRWFFKEALKGFLPADIIAKKKHGFGLPFGVWACQHPALRALTADTLGSLKQRGIIRPGFIGQLLDHHLPSHPGYYGEMVWILVVLELWLRQYAPEYRA